MIEKNYIPLLVNQTPYCVWDENIIERNIEILNRIDPEYFEYIATTNFTFLEEKANADNKQKQHASVALRTAYSQGLETFFALVCASVQAPKCVFGWLLKYRNSDLKDLISNINNGEEFESLVNNKQVNWKFVSELIFSMIHIDDKESFSPYIVAFENLWKTFASDFLNPNFNHEYNSIKHGLRVNMRGSHLAIGKNAPLTKENSIIYSDNEFGSTFFMPQKLDKFNFAIDLHSRNWNPENFFHSLHLISTSIKNVISFLKNINGVDFSNLAYKTPDNLDYFKESKNNSPQVIDLKFSPNPNLEKLNLLTKEQIENYYKITK